MAFYSEFADTDKVTSVGVVTSGIWQDGVSNITTFFQLTSGGGVPCLHA